MGAAPSGPELVPVDSVRLDESDSVYIGRPARPYVDRWDGSFYVPDMFSNEVYRFGRDGRLLRVYGRAGGGPGEFESVGAAFTPDDSTVVVVDRGNHKLSFFDRASGSLRREQGIPGTPAQAPPLVTSAGAVLMHARTAGSEMSLLRVIPGSDTVSWLGRFPGPFVRSLEQGGRYFRFHGTTGFLAEKDEWILHGFRPLHWLYVRDGSGTILDSVYVPAVRREPVPPDLREKLDVERISSLDALELHAALFGVHVRPDDRVALVHQEWELLSRETVPPPTAATVWVSLLSEDLERACVDAKLSESEDAKPMEAFRGDTVFQLERRVVGEGEAPGEQGLRTWLRMVRVDAGECDWIPARPG